MISYQLYANLPTNYQLDFGHSQIHSLRLNTSMSDIYCPCKSEETNHKFEALFVLIVNMGSYFLFLVQCPISSNNIQQMIEDDFRFFRQNFSASSFGQSDEENVPHATYQNVSFKFPLAHKKQPKHLSSSKKHIRANNDNSEEGTFNSREQGRLGHTWVDATKEVQMNILERLKSEHKDIKQLSLVTDSKQQSLQSRDQGFSDLPNEQKKKVGNKHNKVFKQKSQSYRVQENAHEHQWKDSKYHSLSIGQGNSERQRVEVKHVVQAQTGHALKQIQDLKNSRSRQLDFYQSQQRRLQSKVSQYQQSLFEKEKLIQKLKSREPSADDVSKKEIRGLKARLESSQDHINSLKEKLFEKDSQIKQLRGNFKSTVQNEQVFRLEHELEMLKSRERQCEEKIRELETQIYQGNYRPDSYGHVRRESSDLAIELSKLKQTLDQRDELWAQRLTEAVSNQRRQNISQFRQQLQSQGVQSVSQDNQGVRQNNQGQIVPTLDMLISQIQQLKRLGTHSSSQPLQEQIRLIRQFINKVENSQVRVLDQEETDIVQLLKNELSNYKKFIIEEERMKKAFLEELNLYKEQNQDVIEQNKYLRHQLSQIHSNLASTAEPAPNNPMEEDELARLAEIIQEQDMRLLEKAKYIEELEVQLAIPRSPKTIVLQHSGQAFGGGDEVSELYQEIERLKNLLNSEISQLTAINEQKTRSYEKQMKMYEDRIQIYQESIQSTQAQLRDYETRLNHLSNRPNDHAALMQANQQLVQQTIRFRAQMSALIQTNRQLQQQVKERSHAVDHLWQVKQAEFQNVFQIVNRVKGGL